MFADDELKPSAYWNRGRSNHETTTDAITERRHRRLRHRRRRFAHSEDTHCNAIASAVLASQRARHKSRRIGRTYSRPDDTQQVASKLFGGLRQ